MMLFCFLVMANTSWQTLQHSTRSNGLTALVEKIQAKRGSEEGLSPQDIEEVDDVLRILEQDYGECTFTEVELAKQEVKRGKKQLQLQDALSHISQRTSKAALKSLWRQCKEVGMVEFKGFKKIDSALYPELSPDAPNVIKIIDTLKVLAGSSRGVSLQDIESLKALLSRLNATGVSTDDKAFRAATKLLSKVTKQLAIQNALAKVTMMTPTKAKQSLWKQGLRLGMENYDGMVALRVMLDSHCR